MGVISEQTMTHPRKVKYAKIVFDPTQWRSKAAALMAAARQMEPEIAKFWAYADMQIWVRPICRYGSGL